MGGGKKTEPEWSGCACHANLAKIVKEAKQHNLFLDYTMGNTRHNNDFSALSNNIKYKKILSEVRLD